MRDGLRVVQAVLRVRPVRPAQLEWAVVFVVMVMVLLMATSCRGGGISHILSSRSYYPDGSVAP